MQDFKKKPAMLDGPGAFADFGNPKWVAEMRRRAKAAGAKLSEETKEGPTELSARARKKKRIYKRKKTEKKLEP
jgi:hypothetical protein